MPPSIVLKQKFQKRLPLPRVNFVLERHLILSIVLFTFRTCLDVGFDLHFPTMDLVPQENREPQENNEYLSERAIFARNLSQVRELGKPRQSKRERGQAALHDAFELIGGVPRLAIYADENTHEFYQLYFRHTQAIEKSISHTLRILAPSIPPTELDGDITDIEFEEVPSSPQGGEDEPGPQKD